MFDDDGDSHLPERASTPNALNRHLRPAVSTARQHRGPERRPLPFFSSYAEPAEIIDVPTAMLTNDGSITIITNRALSNHPVKPDERDACGTRRQNVDTAELQITIAY